MDGMRIKAIVIGAVVVMISLALLPINVASMDTVSREFVNHCTTTDGQTTLLRAKVMSFSGTTAPAIYAPGTILKGTVPAVGGPCTAPLATLPTAFVAANAGAVTIQLDNGSEYTVTLSGTSSPAQAASGFSGYTVAKPTPVMARFGALNILIASIWPLFLVLAAVATAAVVVFRGSSDMDRTMKAEIGALIALVVMTAIMPSIFDFLSDAALVNSGQYQVTQKFGTLSDLIFGLGPVLLMVGIITWAGYRTYNMAQGGKGMMA